MRSVLDDGAFGRLAIERRVLTPAQLEACRELRERIRAELGLEYSLAQVVFERVYATNPRTRALLVRPGGPSQLIREEVETGFWKLSRAAHERLLERVRTEERVDDAGMRHARLFEGALAGLGIERLPGELLVDLGLVPRQLAEECRDPVASPERLPALAFASIAIHNGLVSETEVQDALELAAQIEEKLGVRIPIGQVLFEMGALARNELEAILAAQARIGRIEPEQACLSVLKLSETEEDALLDRLETRAEIDRAARETATELSIRIAEYGLAIEPVEVLWLTGRIGPEALGDVLEFQREVQWRIESEAPPISLSIAPSLEGDRGLASDRPEDLSEADFLFGQFALLGGALDRRELASAVRILRRVRSETGLDDGLARILFEVYRRDPVRVRVLRNAQREVAELLGTVYAPAPPRLSPVEVEAVLARLAARADLDPGIPRRLEEAIRTSRILAQEGLDRHPVQVLLDRGLLASIDVEDMLLQARERDRRMVGGARRARGGIARERDLFERAFSTGLARPGWGRTNLGSLAVELGLLDRGQLVSALYVQLRTRELGIVKPFGEILVELGVLDAGKLKKLLAVQAERVRRIRDEVDDADDPMAEEDSALLSAIRATGALDEERLARVLSIRRQFRALGLAGAHAEILVRGGELDAEVVQGLQVEALRRSEEERARQEAPASGLSREELALEYQRTIRRTALRGAGRPVRTRSRAPALAAGIALAIVALGAGLTLRLDSGRATFLLRNEGPEAELRSPDGVEDVDPEAWRPAEPPDDPEGFERRMSDLGYVPAGGSWVRSDLLEGLPSRPAGATAPRRRFERLDAVRHPGTDPAGEPLLSDLEASLVPGREETRIGLRFSSRLPEGSRLAVVVSTADAPDRSLAASVLEVLARGRIECEAPPLPVVLGPGEYRVELRFQPVDRVSRRGDGGSRCWTLARVSDPASAQEAEALVAALREALARLAERVEAFEPGLAWVDATLPVVREFRSGLLTRIDPSATPDLARVRERLLAATRIVGEVADALAAGRDPGPEAPDRMRHEIEACRQALGP